MLEYLSADIVCSEKRTVFREQSSRKTVNCEEQIMSKDKYPSIFSQPNWGYCVYYPSVLKIGEYTRIFPSFSWGIFAHVTRLDQSRASENIWWTINPDIMFKYRFTVMLVWSSIYRSLIHGYRWSPTNNQLIKKAQTRLTYDSPWHLSSFASSLMLTSDNKSGFLPF